MPEPTATQPLSADAIISAFAGGQPLPQGQPRQPQAPAEQPANPGVLPGQPLPQQPAAATPAAPEQPAAPAAPAAAPAPAAQEPVDPFIQALSGGAQEVAWTDEAKALFKQTYGEDDPIAFKGKYSEVATKVTLLEKEVEQGRSITAALKRIEESDPVMHAAILESLEGRSGVDYIASQPNVKIVGKAAKELPDNVLLKAYMADKFTPEEWKAYETNDYSDLGVDKDVLVTKIKTLRPAAEFMHDQRNEQHKQTLQGRERQRQEMADRERQWRTEAITTASKDPYARLYVNQENIDRFQTGKLFVGTFYNEDGTQHPNAFAAGIKAERYDSDVKRAYEAGLRAGEQRGAQVAVAQMPAVRPGGRSVQSFDPEKGDPHHATIGAALRS